jgi:hypothetical protein
MNSRFIQLFTLLFIFSLTSNAQTQISGLILDSLTQKPIVGVSVSDSRTGKGTITNEEGQFQIVLDNMPVKLLVSHVAYNKRILEVRNSNFLKVNLPISAIHLPEFQTGNPAIAILNAVIRKAVSDSANKHFYKAFNQKVSYFNGKYTKFQQLFTNVSWSQMGVERWQPLNIRYGQLARQRHFPQNKIVVPFLYSAVIKNHKNFPLNPIDIGSNYVFSIKHYLNIGTPEELVVIKCKPSKSNINIVTFEGELLVNSQKDLLMRIKGTYSQKSQKGFRNTKDVDINFKESKDGSPVFDYLYISDKDNRRLQNYKNEDKIWFYFINESQEFEIIDSRPAYVLKDIKILNETAYNPVYWKQNIPIKQTKIEDEIIKYFEKKGEFQRNF